MDQEKIMQRYAEYKKAQQERLEQDKVLRSQREQTEAFWEAKKQTAGRIVTTRKPHVCCSCHQIIMTGQRATLKTNFTNMAVGGGYTAGFQSLYYCKKCRPIQGNMANITENLNSDLTKLKN